MSAATTRLLAYRAARRSSRSSAARGWCAWRIWPRRSPRWPRPAPISRRRWGPCARANRRGSEASRLLHGSGALTLRSPIAGMVTELHVDARRDPREHRRSAAAHIVGHRRRAAHRSAAGQRPAAGAAAGRELQLRQPRGQRLPLRLVGHRRRCVDPARRLDAVLVRAGGSTAAARPPSSRRGCPGKVQVRLLAGRNGVHDGLRDGGQQRAGGGGADAGAVPRQDSQDTVLRRSDGGGRVRGDGAGDFRRRCGGARRAEPRR